MKRQISFRQYRAIDLLILAALMVLSEFVILFAASHWYADQLYIVSPVAALVALVMMRWNGYAAIHAVLGGLVFAALSKGTWQQFLIYGVGNLFSLLALVLFKALGKERIRQSVFLSLVFALCTQLFMQLGRAGLAFLFGHPAATCLGFITTDTLSGLFTMVIVWIVRRIDGLFEDQKNYLLRVESERQLEGRE